MSEEKKEYIRHILITVRSAGPIEAELAALQNDFHPVGVEISHYFTAAQGKTLDVSVNELHVEDAQTLVGDFFTVEEIENHLNRFYNSTPESVYEAGYEIMEVSKEEFKLLEDESSDAENSE